jgi:hypothetical protein
MSMTRWAVVLVLVGALMGACSDGSTEGGPTLTGVIVAIDAESLGDVESFELRSEESDYTILIDPEVEYEFPLGHLSEHLRSSEPVRVETEERDGEYYAQSIEDA